MKKFEKYFGKVDFGHF